jgi:hypothetical protein
MQREFWYRCRRCDFVWYRHLDLPVIRLPGFLKSRQACPNCHKPDIKPYAEEEKYEGI